MEKEILKKIAEAYPFKLIEVEDVFNYVKSFDKTIKVMDAAIELAVHPSDILKLR